ncbi:MAG TPA: FtsX-like permease family protein [Cyclobacteriaceae bacterium]
MLQNLKLAFRHLWRRRIYTTVILLSLTIGFACTNLLMSFLIAELNTDSFHKNKHRIFQITSDDPFGGKNSITFLPGMLLKHLADNYPEVEKACTVVNRGKAMLSVNETEYNNLTIVSADNSFFEIFDLPITTYSKKVLTPTSIILSKEKAKLFFGEDEAIGKMISYKGPDSTGTLITQLLTVSAVLEDTPEKTHFQFDAIVDSEMNPNRLGGGNGYVLLKSHNTVSNLEQKLNQDNLRPGLTGPGLINYHFDPLKDSYFNKSNPSSFTKTKGKLFIWAGSVVCFLILFIASFNFINLLLLSLHERKKETGIKKTLGVSVKNLFQTTLTEVALYISTAYVLSLAVTSFLLPLFNTTLQTNLSFDYLSRWRVMASLGLIVFLLAAIVIIISTANQWRIKPISLLQNQNNKISFSKFLFTIQFVISITMAICSITIIGQMNFIEQEPLGFNKNIIELNAPDNDSFGKLPILKENLQQLTSIENVTVCSGNPISGNMVVMYKTDGGESYSPYVYSGDEDFFKTLHLTLIEGQLPSANDPDGTVVNEKFASLFNMKNPIGERIPGTPSARIVGVVKNFTSGSFKVETPPVMISYAPINRSLLLSFSDENIASLLPQIEKEWNKVLPSYPFSYRILQQELMNKYKEETSFFRIVIAFSVTSMIISCFGLFALSWAVVQSRVKEIGIRKVLGASPKDIVAILTVTFTKRIFIAFIIAVPIGYYLMNLWLASFVKKIPLSADIFIWSALLVSLIAIITLGMQTVKAALSNPVNELRSE